MAEITLRAIEKSDLALIQHWRNSEGVLRNCRQYRPLSMQDMLTWYGGLGSEKDYNLLNDLFIIESNHIPIGVGGFVRIDWRNRKAEVSFYVGEVDTISPDVVKEALMAVIHYGFATLNLWKVSFPCYGFNAFLPTYKEVMQYEYTAKEEYYWGGKYYDRVILTTFRNDYLRNHHTV